MPEQVRVLTVTHGMLQALGVQPALGRSFIEAEHSPGTNAPNSVIVSYAFWQRRFGGDESALGRTLSLDARSYEIVGIMPPGFRFLDLRPQPDVIDAMRIDATQMRDARSAPSPLGLGFLNYSRSRAAEGWRDARRGERRRRAHAADLARRLAGAPRSARSHCQLADRARADAVEGRRRRRRGRHALGAHGHGRRRAADRVRQHRESAARASRRATARARDPRRARRRPAANRRRAVARESRARRARGRGGTRAWPTPGCSCSQLSRPRTSRASRTSPSARPCSRSPPSRRSSRVSLFGAIPAVKHALGSDARLGAGARGASASRERNRTRSALIVVQVALALVLLVGAGLDDPHVPGADRGRSGVQRCRARPGREHLHSALVDTWSTNAPGDYSARFSNESRRCRA